MAKSYSIQKVKKVLRRLGLTPCGKGDSSGHALWGDDRGRTCKPVFRYREMALAHLYSLGDELASQGVCSRRALIAAVKRL